MLADEEVNQACRVSAACGSLKSAWSAPKVFETDEGLVPGAPSSVTQLVPEYINNATSVFVSWGEAEGYGLPIGGYELEADGGGWVDLGPSRTYLHQQLLPQTWHSYRVRARNEMGSGPNALASFTTGLGTPPEPPAGVRRGHLFGSLSNITSLALAWDEPESDVPISSYWVRVNGSAARKCFDPQNTTFNGAPTANGRSYRHVVVLSPRCHARVAALIRATTASSTRPSSPPPPPLPRAAP